MSLLKCIGEFNGVKLSVLRLNLIDKITGGNKFFKLKYNLEEAAAAGVHTLLTFGGAYSNHIAATAAAGLAAGFKTIGIIRGEKVLPLNKTLQFASDNGMKVEFVSREDYRQKHTKSFIDHLKEKYGDFYLLPEGGSNQLAVKGCMEIVPLIKEHFDFIICPTATGATLLGISLSLKSSQKAIGICVLKNENEIRSFVSGYINENDDAFPEIISDYTFNGYAKTNNTLDEFVTAFSSSFQVPIEPVYSGKMFYGIFDLIGKGKFSPGKAIAAVHTGGMQYL